MMSATQLHRNVHWQTHMWLIALYADHVCFWPSVAAVAYSSTVIIKYFFALCSQVKTSMWFYPALHRCDNAASSTMTAPVQSCSAGSSAEAEQITTKLITNGNSLSDVIRVQYRPSSDWQPNYCITNANQYGKLCSLLLSFLLLFCRRKSSARFALILRVSLIPTQCAFNPQGPVSLSASVWVLAVPGCTWIHWVGLWWVCVDNILVRWRRMMHGGYCWRIQWRTRAMPPLSATEYASS